jgi:hypothetical protein
MIFMEAVQILPRYAAALAIRSNSELTLIHEYEKYYLLSLLPLHLTPRLLCFYTVCIKCGCHNRSPCEWQLPFIYSSHLEAFFVLEMMYFSIFREFFMETKFAKHKGVIKELDNISN